MRNGKYAIKLTTCNELMLDETVLNILPDYLIITSLI